MGHPATRRCRKRRAKPIQIFYSFRKAFEESIFGPRTLARTWGTRIGSAGSVESASASTRYSLLLLTASASAIGVDAAGTLPAAFLCS